MRSIRSLFCISAAAVLVAAMPPLAVAQLGPLVLRDGAHNRSEPLEHAALLAVAQCGRALHVEERVRHD